MDASFNYSTNAGHSNMCAKTFKGPLKDTYIVSVNQRASCSVKCCSQAKLESTNKYLAATEPSMSGQNLTGEEMWHLNTTLFMLQYFLTFTSEYVMKKPFLKPNVMSIF